MFLILLNLVSGLVMILIILSIIFFDRQNARTEIQNLKLITMAALLVALATVLNQISTKFLTNAATTRIFQVRLGDFALMLIGFCCGGMLGSLSGIAADFIGLIFGTSGIPNLFYTLSSMTWCVLPLYLIRALLKISQNRVAIYCYLSITYAITLILISFWNPIIIANLYGAKNGLWPLYLTRIIAFPFNLIYNSFLLIVAYRSLHQHLLINQKLGIKPFAVVKNDKISVSKLQPGVTND